MMIFSHVRAQEGKIQATIGADRYGDGTSLRVLSGLKKSEPTEIESARHVKAQ